MSITSRRCGITNLATEDILSKVTWLFLILPGFVSYTCFKVIAPPQEHSEVQIIAYSFCFLLMNLLAAISISKHLIFGRFLGDRLDDVAINSTTGRSLVLFYVILLSISIFSGITVGIIAERDIFYRFAKSITLIDVPIQDSAKDPLDRILFQNQTGMNNHTSPPPDGRSYDADRASRTISNGAYARITIKDGPVYEGWPLYFTSERRESQIYMSPACLILNSDGKNETRPIFGPGVIVFEKYI